MDEAAFQALVQRANSGDANAQDVLATALAGAGRGEEARVLLEAAARAGRGPALARLGLWDIVGFGAPANPTRGVDRIMAGATGGDSESMHVAALLFGGGIAVPADAQQGLRWLILAARTGHMRALEQLGTLIGAEHPEGRALLQKVAAAGSMVSMYALGRSDDPQSASWLAAAHASGHPLAPAPAAPISAPRVNVLPLHWDDLGSLVDLAWLSAPFQRQVENVAPHIETVPNFLTRAICEYVIGMAAPALQRGKVVERDGEERVSGKRSNAVMHFGLIDSDFLLELVSQRTAHGAEMPPENAEGLGVLHYLPGESYEPHVDYHVETPANAARIASRGQRVRTLLVYLNEGFEGGETEFVRLDRRFKPPAGTALIFHSVDANGRGDPQTIHTGRPPTSGEKWVISKWFRTKALRPGPAAR